MSDDFSLVANYNKVLERMQRAALKSGRELSDITLISVTKTVELERINEYLEIGTCDLGENRVQEIIEKFVGTIKSPNWHLIGQLQTNKVKYIVEKVKMIHSVDRLDLALEIQRQCKKKDRIIDCLIQVNISGEETKSGIIPESAISFCKELSEFPNIKVRGLMTMAPFSENVEDCRPVFRGLKKLSVDIDRENIHNINMDFLSMGMSNDFEIAIEEGSNMIRVGSAIFGKRYLTL